MTDRPTSSDPEQRERDTRESRRQSGLDPDPDVAEGAEDVAEGAEDVAEGAEDAPTPERSRDRLDEDGRGAAE